MTPSGNGWTTVIIANASEHTLTIHSARPNSSAKYIPTHAEQIPASTRIVLFLLVIPSVHCRFLTRARFWWYMVCLLVYRILPAIAEFIVAGLFFPLALCALTATKYDASDVCPPRIHCIFCPDTKLCRNNKLVRIRTLVLAPVGTHNPYLYTYSRNSYLYTICPRSIRLSSIDTSSATTIIKNKAGLLARIIVLHMIAAWSLAPGTVVCRYSHRS